VGANTALAAPKSASQFAVNDGAKEFFLSAGPLFDVLRLKGWDAKTNSLFANLVRSPA
jgi:hypothetical protein